jgi:hypothetical protein
MRMVTDKTQRIIVKRHAQKAVQRLAMHSTLVVRTSKGQCV